MPLPTVFTVKVRDKQTGKVQDLTVTRSASIQNQEEAEQFIENMKTSFGGKHPGFEIVREPATAPATDAAPTPAA